MSDDQFLDITQCRIITEGYGIFLMELAGQADLEKDSPIKVYANIISGNDEAIGIEMGPPIPQKCLLVRNNVIYGCRLGMSLEQGYNPNDPEFLEACYPHIYNNAIFDFYQVGIYCSIRENGDEPTEYARLRNNIIWHGLCEESFGIRVQDATYIHWDEETSLNDIDIANNIIGLCDCGIYLWPTLDDPTIIDYNAFKVYENGSNIENGTLGDNCIVHEEDGKYVKLVCEDPSEDNWDFHILADQIIPGNPDDLNIDLVNTGDSQSNTWVDPNWTRILRRVEGGGDGERELRRVDGIRYTLPDMGIYGGPFCHRNIYSNFHGSGEYILVDDEDSNENGIEDFLEVDMPFEYYRFADGEGINGPGVSNNVCIEPGTVIDFGNNDFNVEGALQVDGDEDTMKVYFFFFDGAYLNYSSQTDVINSYANYLHVIGADYGAYLSGVGQSGSAKLSFNHCVFDSCLTGIYANNSRVSITNSKITNSPSSTGKGVYLVNCSAGMVVMDHDTITHNGTVADYSNTGIYLSSSSPELTDCLIEHNFGSGIACFNSNPDLHTYYSGASHSNDIHSNGEGGSQSGSNGAEIYLASSSYPSIHYNNIWDQNGQNQTLGKLIYKSSSCPNSLSATNNWWGVGTPQNSWFYWDPYQSAITYSPYSGYYLNSAEDFDLAMGYWDAGNYSAAAEYFRRCVSDTGVIGIQSVHYLTGCVGESDGDFAALREFLSDAADEQEDAEVAKVTRRFATHCLTMLEDYESAIEEYDAVRQNADNLNDSVMAVVDILAVEELAGMNGLDAAGGSIQDQMAGAMALLDEGDRETARVLPETFSVAEVYPNPFNGVTTIRYNLQNPERVRVAVCDLSGRLAAMLYEGEQSGGDHYLTWDASGWAAGVYLCRLETGGAVRAVKVALVK